MIAVVTGMIGTFPVGGVAWDYGQYAVGLENLGWEVYYLEDTGGETYDPCARHYGPDCSAGVRFLAESLASMSPTLGKRWFFRNVDGSTYGMSPEDLRSKVEQADLLLNVSGGTLLREEYLACPCKVLIDSDPGWNQFVNFPRWDAEPGWHGTYGYRSHDHFFTYAERIGQPDCCVPDLGIEWKTTRPVVVSDLWRSAIGPRQKWTTVMTWNNFREPVEYAGELYGTKEREFPKVERTPQALPDLRLEVAVGGLAPPVEHWKNLGWLVTDSQSVSGTLEQYHDYICRSRGEFSVAKNLYTATRSGWFSCRSVCYLAAGLPCVVQDTGFSDFIPTGHGLIAFDDQRSAVEALQIVETDYAMHCQAARTLAEEYFEAEVVLSKMLRQVGLV